MADVRYWVAGNRAFGYTPHRQADGKFYAIVYKYDKRSGSGAAVKKRGFARRKKAKAKAYEWYQKRKVTLEKLRVAKPVEPAPTKVEILQRKLTKTQDSLKRLETKKKRLETLIKKRKKQIAYYQKKLLLFSKWGAKVK
jgi:hypothetical protein